MDEATASTEMSPLALEKPEPLSENLMNSVSGLMQGEVTEASTTLIMKVIVPAGLAVLAVIVTYFVAKLAARWITTVACKRIDKTIGKFAGKLCFYSIFTLVGIAILDRVGVSVAGFAAILAAAGFAIGLAFQGTLSNFASGILLLVFRPFKVGDFVNAAGVMGKINEIDLFTTTLDTPDNRRLIIPNSSIAGSTIENITYHKQRRVDVPIGVAYSANLDQTRQVLTACAEAMADKTIQGEGRGFQVLLTNLGASSVEWTVRVWVASENFFAVKESLTSEIKRQLDTHGLEIPFPQMQLHLTERDHAAVATIPETRVLPIPKMNTTSTEHTGNRVRPRVRGETT